MEATNFQARNRNALRAADAACRHEVIGNYKRVSRVGVVKYFGVLFRDGQSAFNVHARSAVGRCPKLTFRTNHGHDNGRNARRCTPSSALVPHYEVAGWI